MDADIDRLTYIIYLIEGWKKNDPQLVDKQGFLKYTQSKEIGQYKVGNVEIWLRYLKEARKKQVTVANLLFDKTRESEKLAFEKKGREPSEKISIDVVNDEKMKELMEISTRLRSHEKQRIEKR